MPRRQHKQQVSIDDQIGLFLYWSSELQNTRMLRNFNENSLTLNFESSKGLQFKTTTPDKEDLRSFLTVLRRFINNDEPVYLFKIYNICFERINSDELHKGLMEARSSWKSSLRSEGFRFEYNGHEFTPEEITSLWINGYYFHDDIEKLNILRSLQPLEGAITHFKFVEHLLGTTRNILYLRRVIIYSRNEGIFR